MSSRLDHDLIDRNLIDRPNAIDRDPTLRAPRKSTDDARQAEAPREVRYMLAFGLVGVIVAFAIIYAIFWL